MPLIGFITIRNKQEKEYQYDEDYFKTFLFVLLI